MKKREYWGLALALGISMVSFSENTTKAADVWDDTTKTLSTDNTLYYSNGTYVSNAEKINITTTGTGKTAPLGGFGLYGNSSRFNFQDKELTIKTSGIVADAVQINHGTTIAYLGNHLTIKTTGYSADGINLTENSQGGKVYIGDNGTIETSGMGVRANNSITNTLSNDIQVGDNLTIMTTGNGANGSDGNGYGVYAGLRTGKASTQKSDSRVIIGKDSRISTVGTAAHAVYANNSGKIVLDENTTINITGENSNGLRSESLSGVIGDTAITLLGNTTISTTKASQYAMYAVGNATNKGIITNVSADASLAAFGDQDFYGSSIDISNQQRIFNVKGDFFADSNGEIHLDMTDGSQIIGKSSLANNGEIDFKMDGAQSFWQLTGNSTLSDLRLTNGASVYLSDSADATNRQVLTVNGNYHGENGRIVFNGILDGDSSPIDKVVIKGDATGTTQVAVNNLGGLGEKTVNGIEIIQIDGSSNTNTFVQSGRIVSGAYDYFVQKGDEQGIDTNNWYLTNRPETKGGSSSQPSLRPEGGAYLGNAYAANNLFQLTLHDRVGEVGLMNWDEGGLKDQDKNIWAHVSTQKVSMDEKSQLIELKQDYNSMRVGFDIVRKKENDRTYLFGMMGGYGHAKTSAKGILYEAQGNISGYNLGFYGTIYDEHQDKSGKYLDTWVSWNNFSGRVSGEGLAVEKYDLNGVTASLETGYDQLTKKVEENPNHNLWLKWQAQVTYQGVIGDGHRESNGTHVSKNDDNIQTRLGVRLYQKVKDGAGQWHQPYAELNWHHNMSTYDISMDGDRNFSTSGVRNMVELKLGYEGQVKKNLQLWGHLSGGLGSHGAYAYGARAGLKYTF